MDHLSNLLNANQDSLGLGKSQRVCISHKLQLNVLSKGILFIYPSPVTGYNNRSPVMKRVFGISQAKNIADILYNKKKKKSQILNSME